MSSPRSILLVDDNPEILEVLTLLLEGEGYAVATAHNGAEALERLRNHVHPELIILDLAMPVMDGWDFRRVQLGDAQLRDIPTIIYSAAAPRRGLDDLRVAGAFDKGGDFGALLRLVADLCSHATTGDASRPARQR